MDIAISSGIRVSAYADQIQNDGFQIQIDSWGSTILYDGACIWFGVPSDDANDPPDYQVGQFSTSEDHPWDQPQNLTSRRINFPRAYSVLPNVVVWLNGLDINFNTNWRVRAYATDIDPTGFTIHIDSWSDTLLYWGNISWIAYPGDNPNTTSGVFSTSDVRPWNQPQFHTVGHVDFQNGTVPKQTPPHVLVALNSIDIDHNYNLRINVFADNITSTGMDWSIDSWYDTILYDAGVSYIAMF
jgi:hypothetical protein